MPRFTIEATLHRSKDIAINAATRQEALRKFRSRFPSFRVESVGGELVLGYCEVSGNPIFDGDNYSQDSEGVMWLNNQPNP